VAVVALPALLLLLLALGAALLVIPEIHGHQPLPNYGKKKRRKKGRRDLRTVLWPSSPAGSYIYTPAE
jgi:hypothetical protein